MSITINPLQVIMMALASKVPMGKAIAEVEKAITTYKTNPSPENEVKLYATCTLISMKGDIAKMERDKEQIDKIAKSEMKQQHPESN